MRIAVGLVAYAAAVRAFSYSFNAPTSCDDVQVSWTGGTPPFNLLLMPVFGTPQNLSIPSSAFSNGAGTFNTSVPLAKGERMLLGMSDATGFDAGGISDILTVGAQQGSRSCNTTKLPPDFLYSDPGELVQCSQYTFSDYSNATLPVTVFAIVPGGNFIELGSSSPSFSWNTNVTAGTSMVFVMVDARGQQGGCSDVKIVGQSTDASCLLASGDVLTQTSAAPSATNTGAPSGSASPTTTSGAPAAPATNASDPDGGHGSHVALIAGSVAGVVVAAAVLVTLGMFCVQQRRRRRGGGAWVPPGKRHSQRASVDLLQPPAAYVGPFGAGAGASTPRAQSPFDDPPPDGDEHRARPFTLPVPEDDDAAGGAARPRRVSQHTNASGRSKASQAGLSRYSSSATSTPRLIVHTDIDEPVPNADGVIELPPQYSASRRPLVKSQFSSASGTIAEASSEHEHAEYDPFRPPPPPAWDGESASAAGPSYQR